MTRTLPLAVLVAALCLPGAVAAVTDWDAIAAEERTVDVITRDEDGDLRETTAWIAVHDGQAFVRTGDSRWGQNIVRDPDLLLRIGDDEYPVRAEFIENTDLRSEVAATFREKYGWMDAMIDVFRGDDSKVMHMLSR